uniref:HlyD family secretion protein n=1 Tax=uncultured Halomonas sp. TaxID=173971 RepID=UPI002620E731|nr:HlyD family secretion protein [uncultured Halomonas sp.]
MSDSEERPHTGGASSDVGGPAEANGGESATPEASEKPNKTGSPARIITLLVLALLIMFVVIYALSDRLAPSSSRGIVSAHVARIAPRVSGQVTEILVEDNAVVEAGDPLFAIDDRPFQLAVRQAQANLETAAQNVSASSASLVAVQAEVTQARVALDNARSKADRMLRLERRGVISVDKADDARAQLADAESRLDSARANLESARAQLGSQGEDNPAILAAESKLEQAQYDLTSTTVKAPHFGVITNVTLSEGQFISAGNPAMTFIDARAAWVTVDLRENQLQNLDPGDTARMLFDAVPGTIYEGRVQSIAWGINPGRNTQEGLVVSQPNNRWFEPARRIPVRIELAGGMEDWPRQVRVGGKVDVTVLTGDSGNPITWIARGLQRLQSWASYLH